MRQGLVRVQLARIDLFMSERYGLRLAAQQRKLFDACDYPSLAKGWEGESKRYLCKLQAIPTPSLKSSASNPI